MLIGFYFYLLNKTNSICHSSLLISISVLFCLTILLSFKVKDVCFKISGYITVCNVFMSKYLHYYIWVKLFKIGKHFDTLLTDVSCRIESTSFKAAPLVTVWSEERRAFQLPVLGLKLRIDYPLNKCFLLNLQFKRVLKITMHLSNEVLRFIKARSAIEHLKNSGKDKT